MGKGYNHYPNCQCGWCTSTWRGGKGRYGARIDPTALYYIHVSDEERAELLALYSQVEPVGGVSTPFDKPRLIDISSYLKVPIIDLAGDLNRIRSQTSARNTKTVSSAWVLTALVIITLFVFWIGIIGAQIVIVALWMCTGYWCGMKKLTKVTVRNMNTVWWAVAFGGFFGSLCANIWAIYLGYLLLWAIFFVPGYLLIRLIALGQRL